MDDNNFDFFLPPPLVRAVCASCSAKSENYVLHENVTPLAGTFFQFFFTFSMETRILDGLWKCLKCSFIFIKVEKKKMQTEVTSLSQMKNKLFVLLVKNNKMLSSVFQFQPERLIEMEIYCYKFKL